MANETMIGSAARLSLIERLVRADRTRPTRLHDANGRLHLTPDILRAGTSTFVRLAFKRYPRLPWLTYGAIRSLERLVAGRHVFEYGSGSSTGWFARHAASIVSVENDAAWAQRVRHDLADISTASLIVASNLEEMVNAIPADRHFDLFVVDCQTAPGYGVTTEALRIRCLEAAMARARSGAVVVVDNTDANKALSIEVDRFGQDRRVERHGGWVPGILHPNETVIIHV
ncbi:hypothetical protein [Brevundimonas sp.]|uniref:hypothetical protein n=1 Tax=Brevundimonas sp. TaxID=1871086 RepID=UPI002608D295|nr:hypothetical protein [Brevundimonas sp.]